MRIFNKYRRVNKNTMNIFIFVVFFCVIICATLLLLFYSSSVTKKSVILINQKTDKIIYQFFSDLITNDVINNTSVNDILKITKNSSGEILTVDYDLEKTYKILTDVSEILKESINNLENGLIDVNLFDKYVKQCRNGLLLYIPLFLGLDNIFLNNIGPKIPVVVNFNESLLTNIRTKVTNYGFNNALLEVYITVEMQKLIITPIEESQNKFQYDILIAALVVNGRIPEFYGGNYQSGSNILDIPIK